MAAGTINTVVGSGTLITFPTLLLLRLSRRSSANVSNTIGLVAGGVTGIHGYRAELRGTGRRCAGSRRCRSLGARRSARCCCCVLPAAAFPAIVPVLIALGAACSSWSARGCRRRAAGRHADGTGARRPARSRAAAWAACSSPGMYGGYFGAAQGVMLMGLLGALPTEPLQRLNGYEERARHHRQRRRRA